MENAEYMFINQYKYTDIGLYLTWQEFKLHNKWEHSWALPEDLMPNFLSLDL